VKSELKFRLERETKGAVRYQEINEQGQPEVNYAIGTLYVRKSALEGRIPQGLTLLITVED